MTGMAAITDTDRFRQGSGRLCLDFLRTLRHRGRPDAAEELTDPAALAAWVRQFAPARAAPTGRRPHPARRRWRRRATCGRRSTG